MTTKTSTQSTLSTQLNEQNEQNEKTKKYPTQTHYQTSLFKPPFIRKNYDSSLRVREHNTSPSLTVQDAKDECDINKILERFEKTGVISHTKNAQPRYGDFTNIPQYQDSLNMALKAQNMFMELPARIREKFKNDPMKFLQFANDPKNQDEMVEMGLATRREQPATAKTPAPEADPTAKAQKPVKNDSSEK